MRLTISTAALLLSSSLAAAQATVPVPQPPTADAPIAAPKALNIGDPAPVLDISNWVKGSPVKFEKDHAYVVEFWATWCGPCRINIPKLTALQARYPANKLTVIGVSIDQPGPETLRP